MKVLIDLVKRPTFVSVFGLLASSLIILLIIYQLLFTNLNGGGSLGIVIEFMILLSLIFLVVLDRIILSVFKDLFWLSVFEGIIIISYLINYYITHNNSFSVG